MTVRESRRTERRFQEVRKLANAVLFDIHNKIQGLPGSTPAREMLVRTALTYLNNLSPDARDDLDLLWDISQAYEQVGDVQGDPGGANLGQFREALSSYRRARELVELVSRRRRDDEVYSCLTWLHYKIGDLEVRTESPAAAIDSYVQGIKVVDRLSGNGRHVAERLPALVNGTASRRRCRRRDRGRTTGRRGCAAHCRTQSGPPAAFQPRPHRHAARQFASNT